MPWFLSTIGESIRLRTLKGTPKRAIRCLNVPRTAYNRSHVNFAPPAHPSAGAIGASLVVNCRAINSRRPALETFQRIDLIDFVDEPRPRRPSARRNHLCVLGCLHRRCRHGLTGPLAPAPGRVPADVPHPMFEPVRNMVAK